MNETEIASLVEQAAQAAGAAYVPYSLYRVGAALRTADGAVITGCNVENASYGLTICAERVALTRAIAAGQREFRAMAIVASGEHTPFPCGACRQVLAEFCNAEFPVYIARSAGDPPECRTLGELLPDAFTFSTGS
jgi:cytidine deaminase